MVRNFKWLLPAVASLVLAVVVGQSRHTAAEPHSPSKFRESREAVPMDYDQTEYRRQNGQWRLTVESVERPYV